VAFFEEVTMSKLRYIARATMAGAIALLVTTTLSAAQDAERTLKPKPRVATQKPVVTKPAKPATDAQTNKSFALALAARAPPEKKEHHLILQVNTNDPAAMNLALNNAVNVTQYYKEIGENVKVEVVTFGPGLHMLRDDTSPVKARIETLALSTPEISYKACGNTQENMRKVENKDIPIIPQGEVVKSGVIHIMQLEEHGWTYVKP
jgi:intracellular sulfur oxidation DsrE/DsrF family protein